jgi:hypothetical protein
MKAEHMFMIFMVLVNLYLILPRLCGMKEYNAVQGASANNIDETAWVNLHAILHELYNSGTLTIPGNLVVKGSVKVEGTNGLESENIKIKHIHSTDTTGDKYVDIHSNMNFGHSGIKAKRLWIRYIMNNDLIDSDGWVDFHHTNVHIVGGKTLQLERVDNQGGNLVVGGSSNLNGDVYMSWNWGDAWHKTGSQWKKVDTQ